MAANDTNRPSQRGGTKDEKTNDRTGSHAKVGFPGKLQAARSTAPSAATNKDIQNVAWVAHEQKRDPADVWAERQNVAESGGGA